MRNLKRALSLTLASVMLLGMMVIGSSATQGYPDVDENDNVEAIEVLQAIGVMVGDAETGNFRPDSPVSRAEMAVVMGLLLNLDYNYYVSTCPFADVSGNYEWARGWVGACAANGIIAGRSATSYDPGATVTAIEAASMMMRALGYFQYASDYEGDFVLSTVRQGSKIGIFSGVGTDAITPMTRNQVATMALNALQTTMVDARKTSADISFGTGDTAVSITGQVEYIVRSSSDSKVSQAISRAESDGSSVSGINGYTVELGEQLYQGDLEKKATTDEFGAPSTRWIYKNNEIGVYADEATAVYTTEVKLKDIHRDLSMSGTVDKDDVTFVIDGVGESGPIYANDGTSSLADATLISTDSGDGALKLGGNGVLVKAYKTADDEVTICVINTYALQVDGEYDTKKEELRLKELDDVTALPTGTSVKLSSEDFAGLDAYRDGDYVLVTVANGVIKTIKAAETFTATVTAYVAKRGDESSNNVTADGTTYKYSKNYTAKTYEVREQYVLVLDSYGYVIFTDGVDIEDQYVYVVAAKAQGGVKGQMEADAYFEDGTPEVILVTSDSVDDLGWTDNETDIHAWFTYERKSGDKYELTPLDGKEDVGGGTTALTSGNITETNSAKVLYASSNKTLFANVDTTFIVLRGDTVTVYNGIREVPDITAKGSGAYVNAVMDGSYAKYVFIEAGRNDLGISGGVDAHIYIYDDEPLVTVDEDGDRVYTYSVIKDGELTTIDMNSKTYASTHNWTLGLYGDLTTDGKGYIDSAERIVDDQDDNDLNLKAYKVNGPKVRIDGDVLSVGGLALVLDRSYEIWVSDGNDTATLTANRFNRDYDEGFVGVVYVALDADGKVTEVYVEEDEDVFDAMSDSPAANVWQQPESATEIADRLKDGVENGFLSADITGSEGLASLGVKQYVEDGDTPTIHIYGTLDEDKVFNKETNDAEVIKMFSIWYYGVDSNGSPKNTFASVEDALKAIYNGSGNETVGAVTVSYGGWTQIQLVKMGSGGSATNGVGSTSINKDFDSDGGNECILDISDLKFPASFIPAS